MNEKKLAGWAASSSSPEEISNRVKGGVIAASSIVIFVAAQFFNINLSAGDVVDLGTQLGVIAGAIYSLYGCGIWLINKFARS